VCGVTDRCRTAGDHVAGVCKHQHTHGFADQTESLCDQGCTQNLGAFERQQRRQKQPSSGVHTSSTGVPRFEAMHHSRQKVVGRSGRSSTDPQPQGTHLAMAVANHLSHAAKLHHKGLMGSCKGKQGGHRREYGGHHAGLWLGGCWIMQYPSTSLQRQVGLARPRDRRHHHLIKYIMSSCSRAVR
jgi:hypothetical protein